MSTQGRHNHERGRRDIVLMLDKVCACVCGGEDYVYINTETMECWGEMNIEYKYTFYTNVCFDGLGRSRRERGNDQSWWTLKVDRDGKD